MHAARETVTSSDGRRTSQPRFHSGKFDVNRDGWLGPNDLGANLTTQTNPRFRSGLRSDDDREGTGTGIHSGQRINDNCDAIKSGGTELDEKDRIKREIQTDRTRDEQVWTDGQLAFEERQELAEAGKGHRQDDRRRRGDRR